MPRSTPNRPTNRPPKIDALAPPAPAIPAGTPNASPAPPPSVKPADNWKHRELYDNVIKALYALPSYFKTDLNITGILATDLFTFNTSLGATIETQVVTALNELREVWDAHNNYSLYNFVRQSQRFPDVILRTAAANVEPLILLGIELKGWYVLAKEREPSFRYKVTPAVCTAADLLVVYPWALSSVVSGSPLLYQAFITGAYDAANYRNYWYQYIKDGGPEKNAIRLSTVKTHYPAKIELISDEAVNDKGNNFGRFARTGIMDQYMSKLFQEELSGIPLSAWQRFFKAFSEEATETSVNRAIDQAIQEAAQARRPLAVGVGDVKATLNRIVALLEE